MRPDRAGVMIGLFFVAAGALFLLEALEVVDVRGTYLWPLLLIGFGAALLAGGLRRRETEPRPGRVRPAGEPGPTTPEPPPGTEEMPPPAEPPRTEELPRDRPPEET